MMSKKFPENNSLDLAEINREMLREWDRKYPGRIENMFSALQDVVPSHLLDGKRFDFKNLRATGVADDEGDKAFDPESFPAAAPPGLQVLSL